MMTVVSIEHLRSAITGPGFVYLVDQVEQPGIVKIGWARNPYVRLLRLRTGSAEAISLVGFIKGDRKDESFLHRRFAKLRVRGEWFKDSDGKIREHFGLLEQLWLSEVA